MSSTDEPASRLSFGDLIPDTRTPMQKRADAVAKAIDRLLTDEDARNDTAVWTDLLERRHGLPEAEQRGFDMRLRRDLIAMINNYAAERDGQELRNYKSFVVKLPLRKTVSAHIWTEMGWWNPGTDDSERFAQIRWLEDQLQHGGLRPERRDLADAFKARRLQHARTDAKQKTEKANQNLATIVIIAVVLVIILMS